MAGYRPPAHVARRTLLQMPALRSLDATCLYYALLLELLSASCQRRRASQDLLAELSPRNTKAAAAALTSDEANGARYTFRPLGGTGSLM